MATVTDAFGRETADALAAWAIDVLAGPWVPLDGKAAEAKVPWSQIRRGRGLLTDAGIDWREIARDAMRQRRDRERVAERERIERERTAGR